MAKLVTLHNPGAPAGRGKKMAKAKKKSAASKAPKRRTAKRRPAKRAGARRWKTVVVAKAPGGGLRVMKNPGRKARRNPSRGGGGGKLSGVSAAWIAGGAVAAFTLAALVPALLGRPADSMVRRGTALGVGVLGAVFYKKKPSLAIGAVAGAATALIGQEVAVKAIELAAKHGPKSVMSGLQTLSGYTTVGNYRALGAVVAEDMAAVVADDMAAVVAEEMGGILPMSPGSATPFG